MNRAKEFLNAELAKYEHLKGAGKNTSPLYSDEGNFQQAKKDGVGRDTILKFLGKNWKRGSLVPTRLTSGSLRKADEPIFDFF